MRFYTNSHPYYCGIDLHARTLYVCILDQAVIIPFLTDTKSRGYAAINGGLPPLALCGLS